MPTYEYECESCGHKLERLQKFSDRRLKKCPECGALRLKRLMSAGAGVIFKGSGFYETDYKRASRGKTTHHEKGADTPCSQCPSRERCEE
jgi:putative FmdB family regulatory protein